MLRLTGENRARASADLSRYIGCDQLVLFVRDSDTGVLIPAPGFPQTLPPGGEWRRFVDACDSEGRSEGPLPSPATGALLPAIGRRVDDGAALVVVGGHVDQEVLESLIELLPLVTAAIQLERRASHEIYSAEAARQAATRAEILASSLYSSQRGLEKALVDAERARARFAFSAEAHALLVSSLEADELLDRLAGLVASSLADLCIIDLSKSEDAQLSTTARAAGSSLPEHLSLLDEYVDSAPRKTAVSEVFQSAEPVLISHVPRCGAEVPAHLTPAQELHATRLADLGGCSAMLVPLRDGSRCLGTLTMISLHPHRRYDEDDLSVACDLALRAGLAVSNSLLYVAAQAGIRAREEFLSIASHELRNPLGALASSLTVVELLLERSSDGTVEALRRPVGIALRQVDRLTKLTENLLDVSRIASGRFDLQLADMDLAASVAELVDGVREEASRTGSEVTLVAPGPVVGRWDRLRIEQVVDNLLSNALKYGGSGPVTVSVAWVGEQARLVVADEGPGISQDALERIFERFERASAAPRPEGLGLGLYICREIVEAHGGSIRAESALGRGSAFEVRLPLIPAPD